MTADFTSPGIMILPLGEIEGEILKMLTYGLIDCFHKSVRVFTGPGIPRYAYWPDRGQYDADLIVAALADSPLVADGTRILGITACDIFSGPLRFVFGLSTNECAVVSLFRLRPEQYGQASSGHILSRRALTEAVHELGHTFGLSHCPDPRCAMYFSNSIIDTDRKRPDFCPTHRKTLESNFRLDPG